MPTDLDFMQLALDEARAAAASGEVPIGALLVFEDKIIAQSGNRTIRDNDPTAHAEIVVLREAARLLSNYRLSGATMYVTLEPCAMCAGALVNARVERLIFGAWDPKAGFCGSLGNLVQDPRLNHRLEVEGGFEAERSRELLQRFFRGLRNRTERWQSG